MRDDEIIERFEKWQVETGKYKGLDLSKVEYLEVGYTDSDYVEFNPAKSEKVKSLIDVNANVSFIPMNSIDDSKGEVDEVFSKPIKELVKGSYRYFENNDILFAKVTPCMENGNCAIVSNLENEIGFGSSEFFVFRPSGKVRAKYLWYQLRNNLLRDQAKSTMSGAGGLKRVP